MATERVYHPETCEPFDVPTAKAGTLVQHGWSRKPWTRVAVPASVAIEVDDVDALIVEDAVSADEGRRGRGRGRQRRSTEVAALEDGDDDAQDASIDAAPEPWRL